jgi:hypothetical protein
VLLTAPDLSPKKDEMIAKEIQEMRDALQAFQTAIEAREVAGFENCAIRSVNSTLFEPLKRIENACRRVSGIMLTASNLPPKDIELIRHEIQGCYWKRSRQPLKPAASNIFA